MSIDHGHDKLRENNRPNELSTDPPSGAQRKRGVSRRKLFQAAIGGTVALGLGVRSSRSSVMTYDVAGWTEVERGNNDDIDNSIAWLKATLVNFYDHANRLKWKKNIRTNCLRAYWRRYSNDTAIVVAFNRRRLSIKQPSWYLSFGFSADNYDAPAVLDDVKQLCLGVTLPGGNAWDKKVGRRTDLTEAKILGSRLGDLYVKAIDAGLLCDEDEQLTPAYFKNGTLVWPAVYERLVKADANCP